MASRLFPASEFIRSQIGRIANKNIVDTGDENPAVNVRACGEKCKVSTARIHQTGGILVTIAFQAGCRAQLGHVQVPDILPLEMRTGGTACSVPVIEIPIIAGCPADDGFEGVSIPLKNIVEHDGVFHRRNHAHGIASRRIRPTGVVVDQHDAVRVPRPLDARPAEIGELVADDPRWALCDGSEGDADQHRVDAVVAKTLVDAGALRLQSIVADVVNVVIVDIRVEGDVRILEGGG